MWNLLIIFGIVVLIKFAINLSRYLSCIRYHKIYNANLNKPAWKVEEIQPQIASLFKSAGIEDSPVPYIQPVGYNKIITASVSSLENIASTRLDVVQVITTMFHRARGVYRSRMLDAINPIYWLLFIIYLPRDVLQFVGASPENALVRFLQVIYWILAAIVGFLIGVFPNEINAFIRSVLGIP